MPSCVRSAWRALRQSPISAGVAIATLGLTLGIGTAIVAVVEQAVFAPPPFADIDSLAIVGPVATDAPTSQPRPVSALTLATWRNVAATVAQLEAYDPTNVTITGVGQPIASLLQRQLRRCCHCLASHPKSDAISPQTINASS